MPEPDMPIEEGLQWGWLVRVADKALWDDEGLRITVQQVQLAREAGALDQLTILLNMMAMDAVWNGDFAAATSLAAEDGVVREAIGSRNRTLRCHDARRVDLRGLVSNRPGLRGWRPCGQSASTSTPQ